MNSKELDDLLFGRTSISTGSDSGSNYTSGNSYLSEDEVDRLADEASRTYGVPKHLIRGIIDIENPKYDPKAKNPNSSATGLMQTIDSTSKALGINDPTNPRESVFGGTKLLKQLLDKYGDEETATAAYFQGEAKVDSYIKSGKTVKNMTETDASGTDTQSYLSKVGEKKQKYLTGIQPNTTTSNGSQGVSGDRLDELLFGKPDQEQIETPSTAKNESFGVLQADQNVTVPQQQPAMQPITGMQQPTELQSLQEKSTEKKQLPFVGNFVEMLKTMARTPISMLRGIGEGAMSATNKIATGQIDNAIKSLNDNKDKYVSGIPENDPIIKKMLSGLPFITYDKLQEIKNEKGVYDTQSLYSMLEDAKDKRTEFNPKDVTEPIRSIENLLKEKDVERLGGVGGVLQDLTSSVTQVAAQLGLNAINPSLAATSMISLIGGSSIEELEKKGVDPMDGAALSLANAALQYPLEKLGLEKIANNVAVKNATGKILKRVVSSFLGEGVTEGIQEIPDYILTDWFVKTKGMNLKEKIDTLVKDLPELGKRAGYSVFIGGLTGSAVTGAGIAVDQALNGKERTEKKSIEDTWDQEMTDTQQKVESDPDFQRAINTPDLTGTMQPIVDMQGYRDRMRAEQVQGDEYIAGKIASEQQQPEVEIPEGLKPEPAVQKTSQKQAEEPGVYKEKPGSKSVLKSIVERTEQDVKDRTESIRYAYESMGVKSVDEFMGLPEEEQAKRFNKLDSEATPKNEKAQRALLEFTRVLDLKEQGKNTEESPITPESTPITPESDFKGKVITFKGQPKTFQGKDVSKEYVGEITGSTRDGKFLKVNVKNKDGSEKLFNVPISRITEIDGVDNIPESIVIPKEENRSEEGNTIRSNANTKTQIQKDELRKISEENGSKDNGPQEIAATEDQLNIGKELASANGNIIFQRSNNGLKAINQNTGEKIERKPTFDFKDKESGYNFTLTEEELNNEGIAKKLEKIKENRTTDEKFRRDNGLTPTSELDAQDKASKLKKTTNNIISDVSIQQINTEGDKNELESEEAKSKYAGKSTSKRRAIIKQTGKDEEYDTEYKQEQYKSEVVRQIYSELKNSTHKNKKGESKNGMWSGWESDFKILTGEKRGKYSKEMERYIVEEYITPAETNPEVKEYLNDIGINIDNINDFEQLLRTSKTEKEFRDYHKDYELKKFGARKTVKEESNDNAVFKKLNKQISENVENVKKWTQEERELYEGVVGNLDDHVKFLSLDKELKDDPIDSVKKWSDEDLDFYVNELSKQGVSDVDEYIDNILTENGINPSSIQIEEPVFSEETGDILQGTEFGDKRTKTQKEIDRYIQNKEKNKKGTDLSGLPMFDKNEQEAMATVQEDLFKQKTPAIERPEEQKAEFEAINTNPTEPQKEAGNYRKAHIKREGMDISIENEAGSERSGKDKSGKVWKTKMNHDYGYIRGTKGADAFRTPDGTDQLDVFINPNSPEGGDVFVVNQKDPTTGKFDEAKVMMGFKNKVEAAKAYNSNYEKGWKGLKSIVRMPMDQFKQWAYSEDTKNELTEKIASKYASGQFSNKEQTGADAPVHTDDVIALIQEAKTKGEFVIYHKKYESEKDNGTDGSDATDNEYAAAEAVFNKNPEKLSDRQRDILEAEWGMSIEDAVAAREQGEEEDSPVFARSRDINQMKMDLFDGGNAEQQQEMDLFQQIVPKQQNKEPSLFSNETGDLFAGTQFGDKRTNTQKEIDRIQREKKDKADRNYKGTTGLPLFDKNEQEAMATDQLDLFGNPSFARGKIKLVDTAGNPIDLKLIDEYDWENPITHQTPDKNFDGIIKKEGLFNGLFTLEGFEGNSMGRGQKHVTYIPRKNKVARRGKIDIEDEGFLALKEMFPDATDEQLDVLSETVLSDKEYRNVIDKEYDGNNILESIISIPLEYVGYGDEVSNISWVLQGIRGEIAQKQGFDAIKMNDENGISYLIPSGSKALYLGEVKDYDQLETIKNQLKKSGDVPSFARSAKSEKTGNPQIYTPEFKKWFGDWENDPENASKVVDESGKPLVVYHGTMRGGFNEFWMGNSGMGYFTTNPKYAEMYMFMPSAIVKSSSDKKGDGGAVTYPVYLSIKNLFDTQNNPEHRAIFENEFYRKYGNGTPLDPERDLPDWTDAEDLKEFFSDKGYNFDGIKLAESHGNITYAAFNPGQIKSATGNNGAFDAENPDIRFARGKKVLSSATDEKNMVGLHNLSEESLANIDRFGGMAAPSVAVLKRDMPHSGFGDITLLAPKELINPETTPVYSSDIYSGTVPEPVYRTNKKEANKLVVDINRVAYGDLRSSYGGEIERYIRNGDRRRFVQEMDDIYVKSVFLKENSIQLQRIEKNVDVENADIFTNPAVKKFIENGFTYDQLEKDTSFAKDLRSVLNSYIDKRYKSRPADIKETLRESYLDRFFNDDGTPSFSAVDKLRRDLLNYGKKEFDRQEYQKWVNTQIEKIGNDKFSEWVNKKADEIFHTPYIDKKGKPEYTLENIVAAIINSGNVGVQKNLTFGLNQAKSFGAKRFKSFDEIKSKRDKITDYETYDKEKDALQKKFFDLADKIATDYKYYSAGSMNFDRFDDLSRAIATYYKGPKTEGGAIAALRKNDYSVSGVNVGEFMRLADELITSPVVYFEAKLQRPVQLGEFAGAVIPKTASQKTRDILNKNNVPFVEYDPEIKGDREKKIQLYESDREIFFARGRTPMPPKYDIVDGIHKVGMHEASQALHKNLQEYDAWAEEQPLPAVFTHGPNEYFKKTKYMLITPSISEKDRPYRITYFEENDNGQMEPLGHYATKTKAEAFREVRSSEYDYTGKIFFSKNKELLKGAQSNEVPKTRTSTDGQGRTGSGPEGNLDLPRATDERSQGIQRRLSSILERYAGNSGESDRVQVIAPEGDQYGITGLIEEFTGKEVVWIKTDVSLDSELGFSPDGIAFPKSIAPDLANKIFINVNSSRPTLWVAGHELWHFLEQNKTYNDLFWNSVKVTSKGNALLKTMAKDLKDAARSEFAADIVGEMITDPEFLEVLHKQNASVFDKIFRKLVEILTKLSKSLKAAFIGEAGRSKEYESLIENVDEVRQALARILSSYRKSFQGGRRVDVVSDVAAAMMQLAGPKAEVKPVDMFYSPLLKAVRGLKQEKGTGEQFFNMLTKAPGVKEAEWKWMGLDDFLKGKKSVTRGEIEEFVRGNEVQVEGVAIDGIGKQQSIAITPAMKDAVLYEGQPLFAGKRVQAEQIYSQEFKKWFEYEGGTANEKPKKQTEFKLPKITGLADAGTYADIGESLIPGTKPVVKKQEQEVVKDNENVARSMQMPEIVEMVKAINGGKVPRIKERVGRDPALNGIFKTGSQEIHLRADLFKDPIVAAKVLAHEIGHLSDYLPDKTMSRGNILGRIGTLKRYTSILLNGKPQKKQIMDELKALSMKWKPFDPAANKKYTAYRHSSKELYADAFSVLINNPGMLQKEAPTFYENFMRFIDKKPELNKIYNEIQTRLFDPNAVGKHRLEGLYSMVDQTDNLRQEARDRAKKEALSVGDFIYKYFIDRDYALLKKIKSGKKGNEDVAKKAQKAKDEIEQTKYLATRVQNFVEDIADSVLKPLSDNGLTHSDLGVYMFLNRASTERATIANPRGFGEAESVSAMEELEKQLGKEKFEKLKEIDKSYRELRKNIIVEAEKAGLYTPDLVKTMKERVDSYAKFSVASYMEEKFGGEASSKVFHQIGTLADIANPFVETVMQDMSVIRSAKINTMKSTVLDFLSEMGESAEADMVFSQDINGRIAKPPKDPNKKLVHRMKDGKMESFYISKEIADSFERNPVEASAVADIISTITSPVKQILVAKNPIWMARNVVRDFQSTVKNNPEVRLRDIPKLAKYYADAYTEVIGAVFKGNRSADLREMRENFMLNPDRVYSGKDVYYDNEIERIATEWQVDPRQAERYDSIKGRLKQAWDVLNKMGKVSELGGKLAGYKYLKGETKLSTNEIGHRVRTRIGTPDARRQGVAHQITNNIWMFSNISKEGTRSMVESFNEDRGAYIWKSLMLNVIPKLVMYGAAATLAATGDDWLKNLLDKIPEYDKQSYSIIPVGINNAGKAVYIRVPQDYEGQNWGAIAWALANGRVMGDGGALDKASGFIPYTPSSLNPYIKVGADLFTYYVRGQNPVDDFRGRDVIPPKAFAVGGLEANKYMVQDIWGKLGGNTIYSPNDYSDRKDDVVEKVLRYPGLNVLGSFLRYSDRGESESYYRNKNDEIKEKAKLSLKAEEMIAKRIKSSKAIPTTDDIFQSFRELKAKKLIGDDKSYAEFRNQFFRVAAKTVRDNDIKFLLRLSKKERRAALPEMQKKLSPADYRNLVDDLNGMGALQ